MKYEYKRKILYKNKNCELVLITWPPSSKSFPHDHGKSQGYIFVVQGSVRQHIYDKKTKKKRSILYNSKGETFLETKDIIHIMENVSNKKVAITLHLYTPPLHMNRYPKDMLIC